MHVTQLHKWREFIYIHCTHEYSYMVSEANVTDAVQFLVVLALWS